VDWLIAEGGEGGESLKPGDVAEELVELLASLGYSPRAELGGRALLCDCSTDQPLAGG
jgi:hypothetical protein